MNAWEKLGKQMCYGDITINYQVRLTIGASNERDVLSVKQGHIVHKTAKSERKKCSVLPSNILVLYVVAC